MDGSKHGYAIGENSAKVLTAHVNLRQPVGPVWVHCYITILRWVWYQVVGLNEHLR